MVAELVACIITICGAEPCFDVHFTTKPKIAARMVSETKKANPGSQVKVRCKKK